MKALVQAVGNEYVIVTDSDLNKAFWLLLWHPDTDAIRTLGPSADMEAVDQRFLKYCSRTTAYDVLVPTVPVMVPIPDPVVGDKISTWLNQVCKAVRMHISGHGRVS